MRVIITGGAGFLGQRLARALLDHGMLSDHGGARRPVSRLLLVDVVPAPDMGDPRVSALTGDVTDPALLEQALDAGADSVFHLAAVLSGEAEQNFELGWRVNVDATRLLLEACRKLRSPPRLVFSSSVAVFGGALPDILPDSQALTPQSSYGAQKAVAEYLVHDYTRKGFLDGRSLRLPTVTVRPGKPNRAASSFASGIIREPLNGVEAICPVLPQTRMWLLSPRAAVANLLRGHEAPPSSFADTRSVNVPGISVTVGEMVDALRRVAGDQVAARVQWRHDEAIDRIIGTWPRNFEATLGHRLGMVADADFEAIIRDYIRDELGG